MSPDEIPDLFDSHCHIQSAGSPGGESSTRELWAKADMINPSDIISRANQAGVTRLVCVGCDLEDSKLAVKFAQRHENCWATIGVHPHEAEGYLSQTAQSALEGLARESKVVAIGECGLDYFYNHSSAQAQEEVLRLQIELARKHDLPLVFHVREAFDDFWRIFEGYMSADHPLRGVLHSFTDTGSNLERALGHGLFIGVNGIATFTKNAEQLEMYRTVPLEHLLLETDAPFLTPHPYRGKVCEPYHIRTIAEFLAKLRGETIESVAEATTHNARQLFKV